VLEERTAGLGTRLRPASSIRPLTFPRRGWLRQTRAGPEGRQELLQPSPQRGQSYLAENRDFRRRRARAACRGSARRSPRLRRRFGGGDERESGPKLTAYGGRAALEDLRDEGRASVLEANAEDEGENRGYPDSSHRQAAAAKLMLRSPGGRAALRPHRGRPGCRVRVNDLAFGPAHCKRSARGGEVADWLLTPATARKALLAFLPQQLPFPPERAPARRFSMAGKSIDPPSIGAPPAGGYDIYGTGRSRPGIFGQYIPGKPNHHRQETWPGAASEGRTRRRIFVANVRAQGRHGDSAALIALCVSCGPLLDENRQRCCFEPTKGAITSAPPNNGTAGLRVRRNDSKIQDLRPTLLTQKAVFSAASRRMTPTRDLTAYIAQAHLRWRSMT